MLRLRISVYSINVLFGLPTHSFIIWLIVTGTGSGIASDFLIFNLSVCEIGLCLNGVFAFFYSLQFSNLSGLMYFLSGLGITARPLFQCLMCVERYLAVIHPVTFLKYKPLRYRLICSAAAWIITLVSCSCLCMFGIISSKTFFSIQFLLFLSIQLFCCLAVLRAVKQSGPEREEENHMKRKAFYLILITTVSMLIGYIPASFLGFIYLFEDRFPLEPFLISFVSFVFAGFVHPILYLNRAGCLSS
ncbi:hypothetical protein E1301_Tti011758 [Triplophysa tibetana]|uniref:G-protein coupled receptors family 1 profile domain-containing protein n=1 Tax=Triplophysa tibetana TaxID=1572043 RepID=A0A5A9PDQ8_9TELE|nr:hypothetical protein E1301_Tti011758 [Triplophysa tibetana]